VKRPGPWVVVLLASLGASLAHGQAGLRLHPQQEAYLPGEEVWIQVPEEALAAEEFELLLRVPSLTLRQLRLTPSMAPQGRWLRLTVPHLPWTRACIVLRAGQGGREWEAARSPVFLVLPSAQRSLPGWRWAQGEWWLDERPGLSAPFGTLLEAFQQGEPLPLPLPAPAPRSPQGTVQRRVVPSGVLVKPRRQPYLPGRCPQAGAQINLPLRE